MPPENLPVPVRTVPYVTPQVQIYYPQVYGMTQLQVEARINQAIAAQTRRLIQEQNRYQTEGQTTMTGSYELKTNERGVLSLTQYNYAYTPPMAHGMTLLGSLTFDVRTGKVYTLKELFKPGSNYVERISRIIEAQIKMRDIPLLDDFKGIRPDQDFYIADKCLVIYFQLYEITPYVFGFPMFPISVYELQDIVEENGPLGVMLPGL